MLSLLDIAERVQEGSKLDEKAWNMCLFNKMNELVHRHQLTYPNDGCFFNMDDALADRAFHVAVDFLVEIGVYCISTTRVIQFTRGEVLGTINAMPKPAGQLLRAYCSRRLGSGG